MHLQNFSFALRRPLLAIAVTLTAVALRAEIAVVVNEQKLALVNGAQRVLSNPQIGSLSIIDLSGPTPRLVAEVEGVPSSMVGPAVSVAVTPDEGLALATGANKVDPANPTRQAPDNKLTVVDLKAAPPRVIATLETGPGASGVSINRAGNLALVANKGEGTVSVFAIAGKSVTRVGRVQVGTAAAGVNHAIFTPDGKRALVTRDGDHMVTMLNVDGQNVTLANRNIRTGLKPYGADVSRDGRMAVVANVGYLAGDMDTIGVIDLQANPPRTADVVTVGFVPESVRLSPDGTACAVVLQNGSNRPKDSPFFSPNGKLLMLRVEGLKLTRVAEAPLGSWPQGAVFSADGRTLLVVNAGNQEVQVFKWDGQTLVDTKQSIKVKGGPAAIATAGR
ncbi:MAG: YncE family protein [Opitutus sp.]|nr:YncE family protein [Opitutus sp.]